MYKKSPKSAAGKEFKPKSDRPTANFDKKPFKRKDDGERGSFGKSRENSSKEEKPFRKREEGNFDRPKRASKFDGGDRPSRDEKPFRKREGDREERSFDKPRRKIEGNDRPSRDEKPFRKREGDREERSSDKPRRKFEGNDRPSREEKPFRKREGDREERSSDKPRRKFEGGDRPSRDEKPFRKHEGDREEKPRKRFADNDPFAREVDDKKEKPVKTGTTFKKELEDSERHYKKGDMATKKPFAGMPERKKNREDYRKETRLSEKDEFKKAVQENDKDYFGDDDDWEVEGNKRPKMPSAATYPMPLNKYIAHSGECSRRDAAELIKQGKVKVNGELITEPGHKIEQDDKVTLSGKKLTPQKGLVYVLLNKPKGFITTNEDERGRKTVMDLVANADAGRLFPVGRLDRATTGLILLTNDGNLTQKLSHPSFNIKKVYHVTLDKPLTKTDFEKVMSGLELEDGKAEVDEMAYLEAKNELGLEIHSGKNRIVRRIFESMGYVVEKLDRMMYAGLTKKNLPRGKWRYLNEQEIVLLKHFKS